MKRRDFIGVAAVTAVGAACGRIPDDENAPQSSLGEDAAGREITGLIEAKMAEYRVPGVAFGLIRDGRTMLRGFGVTNLDNPQTVSEDTVFPIASISKTVVSTAMMRLVERGQMDLEAPVRDYLPDFRVQDDVASREVRIWHLLTHTPGWEGQLSTADRGPETLAFFTEGLRDLPQLARPGEVWSYNNAGFGLAGRVLEVVGGGTINEVLSDLVFEPLGLTHAFTRTGNAMTYRFAAPHREQGGDTTVIRPFALPANVSAGGAAMSIGSLMSYADFHLGDGRVGGEQVLTSATLERMREPRVTKNATTDAMGIGWHLRELSGVRTAAHGGTLGGHCLHVQLVPERGLAFGILTNHNQGWRLIQDVERAILERYEGLALAPGQATGGNRGGNEVMTAHAQPLAAQPSPDDYVGTYRRPPRSGEIRVSAHGGRVQYSSSPTNTVPLLFWGEDVAYAAPEREGPYYGMPVEFIRRADGSVGWMRVNGRISMKV